jgi:hypothetical protein
MKNIGMKTKKFRSPTVRSLILIIAWLLFINSQAAIAENIQLLSPEGERINYSAIKGNQYTLLYIVKPWHGITMDMLKELQTSEKAFYGRVKPVIVFTDTKRAVANAFMQKLNFKKIPYFIDDTFVLTQKLNPFILPMCVLLSNNDSEVARTSSPGKEFLKQLSQNPASYIQYLNKQRTGKIKKSKEIHKVHSPWGPPEDKIENGQYDGHTSK